MFVRKAYSGRPLFYATPGTGYSIKHQTTRATQRTATERGERGEQARGLRDYQLTLCWQSRDSRFAPGKRQSPVVSVSFQTVGVVAQDTPDSRKAAIAPDIDPWHAAPRDTTFVFQDIFLTLERRDRPALSFADCTRVASTRLTPSHSARAINPMVST